MHLARRTISLIAIAFLVAACGGGGSAAQPEPPPAPVTVDYRVPFSTGDGWEVAHLADNGFDVAIMQDMLDRIVDGTYDGIDGVAVARYGKLVLYENFRDELDEFDPWIGNNILARHILHSTSKSVTSALIGIAIDQGYIESTDVSFYGLFNYTAYENWDARKDAMTLEDALTMRLGFEWDEWTVPYGSKGNDLHDLTENNGDYALALLNMPLSHAPGTIYAYNTAATIAIGQALEHSVGMPMDDFADTYLFEPLQIFDADWGETIYGLPNGGSGLFLAPRDMLKFGQLFISGGVWNGQQVISQDWVDRSVARHVDLDWNWTSGYGYQWWRGKFMHPDGTRQMETWSTRGYGGQYIFCIPELQLVIAFTGRNYGVAGSDYGFALTQDFILRAITDAS